MKFIFTLLFFISAIGYSIAQQFHTQLDSLYELIDRSSYSDTSMIDVRNQYLRLALFANPADSSLLGLAEETIQLALEIGYWKGLLMANERMALIYQYSFSNPYKALEYYHKALDIMMNYKGLEKNGWSIYGGIGTLYYEQEEYKKALEYFRKVLNQDPNQALTATANIANIYGSQNKYDSAIYFYKKALDLEQLSKNPAYRANLYSNLSLIYSQAGRADSALISAKKSIGLIEEYGIEFVRPTAYANVSMAYLSNRDFQKAEYYATAALELSKTQGNLFLQRSAWGTLADLYAATGDYRSALEAYKTYSVLKDSLNNQNRRVEISKKQMEFDFKQERNRSEAEIQRQTTIKRASVIGGSGIIIASFIGFVLYKRRRDAEEQTKEAEFKALVADTELKALRAQMNPHFIFNSLNSIGDFILKNNNEMAMDYLTKFARLMRMVLENSDSTFIPLIEDLNFLELYLQVESKRQPGKFTWSFHVDEGLDTENILVPPLILQPFIENSIWHGFRNKEEQGHIQITISEREDMLICSVLDNGVGLIQDSEASAERKSFGVNITENRLKILNRNNGITCNLNIWTYPSKPGTHVEIELPLEYQF